MVNLTINGQKLQAEENSTILEAARKANIEIPTLCFLKNINEIGDCRMCVVEVEGRRNFATACISKVEEGMVINTNSAKVIEARKLVLDLILSNHNRDCLTCTRNGNCELQNLAEKFGVTKIDYEGEKSSGELDEISPSIVRDVSKCILCRRCISTCKNIQGIGAIECVNRGFNSKISTAGEKSLNDVNCTFCGQCIQSCPVGALKEKDSTEIVWDKIMDKDTFVVVQTAPAVRAALGEEFGMEIGTNVTGKMVTALKRLGFDKVFDTNTGADITIVEEGNEFLQRLNNNGVLPMITSCSPGWVRYSEMYYPELLDHLSSCKSPHQMFGAMLKSYYAEKMGIDPKKMFVVSVMPCIAKKFERTREEMPDDVDCVITTRELARMIKQAHIDFVSLPDSLFDDPTGEATGAGAIFGTTGGVMEAALRTVEQKLTGNVFAKLEYEPIRGAEGIKRATLNLAGREVKIVVASGLKNAQIIMDEIKEGKADYHFVEIMACPGGCVMGGGQPIKTAQVRESVDVRAKRAACLYSIDEASTIRKSHENPVIKDMYENYLGEVGGEKAHHLLHTTYSKKEKYRA